MINGKYLTCELTGRLRRSVVNTGLVALAVSIMVSVSLLADSLERAFQTPLNDINADITVQMAGDVPEQMAGPVLPCSVAPISEEQSRHLALIPGVRTISRAVLFWDFSDDALQIVVGLNPEDTAGPALLSSAVISGRMLTEQDAAMALAEVSWAAKEGIKPGDRVRIGGRPFSVVGLVDTSRISRIGTANLYIPLPDAQAIVASAPGVAEVHHFGPQDSNLLFIQADRDKSEDIARQIKALLGDKTSVATPNSFKKMLGSLFSLTSRFSHMISTAVFLFALLLLSRNGVAAVRERAKEIGTLKAVGWTGPDIRHQLLAENCCFIVSGTLLGLGLGFFAAWGLSFVSIAIPIPWDMAPTPHFLPGGEEQLFRQVRLSMRPDWHLVLSASLAPLILGIAASWTAGLALTRLRTSEVFRYE